MYTKKIFYAFCSGRSRNFNSTVCFLQLMLTEFTGNESTHERQLYAKGSSLEIVLQFTYLSVVVMTCNKNIPYVMGNIGFYSFLRMAGVEWGESPVRVVVVPSQSAFFAGEPFSVKITFTNTRSTHEAGSSKPTHKRASHSVSSTPLAPLPTSPGTPRSGLVSSTNKQLKCDIPRRKNLIGKLQSGPQLPDLIEQRRKRQLAPKSLSVSVVPYDALGVVSLPKVAVAPRTSSPLARTDTLNLSSNHPHARKHSVLDGQLSLDYLSPTTSVPPLPYTPSSSTSSFTLALDAITEGVQSPYLGTPTIGSPTIEPISLPPPPNSNTLYGYTPRMHRPAPIGLGHPPSASPIRPRTTNELILYSYAQLSGTLILTPPDQSEGLNALRSALLNRSIIGGGRMDITSSLNSPNPSSPPTPRSPRNRQSHTRSSSFSAGLLSILSPTLASSISTPSTQNSPRWRTNSGYLPSGWTSSGPNTSGFVGGTESDSIDPEEPLPTLEIQPALLAVDLSLAPGETRTCTFPFFSFFFFFAGFNSCHRHVYHPTTG